MSFNLVDLIKNQVTGPVLGQISNAAGENFASTNVVINGAIPVLLGGFMNKASSGEGAGALFDAVNNQDDSILDNLTGMMSGDNRSSLVESGGNILGSLFGDSGASSLASAVTGSSGVSSAGASTILSMLAPMVMSTIKRFMSGGDRNDADGLANMLMSQKDNIAGSMPSGLADQLGSSGFLSNVGDLFGSGAGIAGAAAAGVAGLAGSATDAVSGTADEIADMAGDAVGGVTDAVAGAVDAAGDIAKDAVDGVSGTIGDVAGAADMAKGVVDDVADTASSAVDGVTSAVVDSVTSAVGDVADGATNLAGSSVDAVSGAANEAVSSGGSFLKKLILPLILAALAFFGWKTFSGLSMPDVSSSAVSSMASGDVSANITSMFGSATESLSSITDAESAKAAIPALADFSGKLDGITSMADNLPAAAKPILSGALDKVMPMLDKVMAIPGVDAVLGSTIKPLKEKLIALAG